VQIQLLQVLNRVPDNSLHATLISLMHKKSLFHAILTHTQTLLGGVTINYIPKRRVNIGAKVSFFFNCQKLSSYSLDHSNFTSLRVKQVKGHYCKEALYKSPIISY